MKKRFLAIISILTVLCFLYIFHRLVPSIYFGAGKVAYENKDYVNAYNLLKIAESLNHKDKDIRYYYVKTLEKLKPTLDIQKEFFRVSQTNLADSADLIADRQVAKWRQQILFKVGENYIQQAPYNNKILRWDEDKFPLSVSIENTSSAKLPEYYDTDFKRAFLQWQQATGFIKFKFIDDPKEADIVVRIISSKDLKDCEGEGCKYVVAFTTPTINRNRLEKMEIDFYDLNNLGEPFSQKEIYNTALHEIGHALGVMGHSYNKDDLMYMSSNLGNNFGKKQSDLQLISSVDLNTLNLLYKLIPDITNTDLAEFDTSRQFFAPIIMGSEKQINSRKILEAQNYIKSAPNLPNGYIDLAAAYDEEKEYNSAIEALNKALSLSYNDGEKFIVYYNLAILYMNIQDWDNSLKYANLAKQLDSNSDIDGLIAGINFNRGNKNFAKQSYINALEKNPENITDALNLTRIYLKEFNFIGAGQTLNRLVKANPKAKEDSRVKAYGALMFLFK